MPIYKETIEELQKIIRNEYGRDLSFAEASEIAYGLLGYFDTLARINNKIENNNESTKRSKNV